VETLIGPDRSDDAACGHNLTIGGRHAVRVCGSIHPGRGQYVGDFLICSECWDAHDHLSYLIGKVGWLYGDGNSVVGLYGGAQTTGVLPCEACGLPVERGRNVRTKAHTCSRGCTVLLSKRRTTVSPGVTRRCPQCGDEINGRADKRYCSGRCRQGAHRGAESVPAIVTRLQDEQQRFYASHPMP
jgi:hypothetical protein